MPQEFDFDRAWLDKFSNCLDDSQCRAVMTGCACQYPKSDLQDVREAYESSGDIDLAHKVLQEKFEEFLINVLHLRDEHFEAVVSRGWGLAGIKDGNTITATKIPKSDFLVQYLDESDPQKKREYYCHCPRVRVAVGYGETLPLIH